MQIDREFYVNGSVGTYGISINTSTSLTGFICRIAFLFVGDLHGSSFIYLLGNISAKCTNVIDLKPHFI